MHLHEVVNKKIRDAVKYTLRIASENDKIMYTKDAEQMQILEDQILKDLNIPNELEKINDNQKTP